MASYLIFSTRGGLNFQARVSASSHKKAVQKYVDQQRNPPEVSGTEGHDYQYAAVKMSDYRKFQTHDR